MESSKDPLAILFGRRVRELRATRSLSRAALAEAIGIGAVALSRIERGERFPWRNLVSIADALDVEVRDLFDFSARWGHGATATEACALIERASDDQQALILRIVRAVLAR